MENNFFKNKSPRLEKLLQYGFLQERGDFVFNTEILDGQFTMRVTVSADGKVFSEVVDCVSQEPYTLHLVPDACGAFVGGVRAEYDRVLSVVADKCFERNVFRDSISRGLIEYIRNKYGDELEFLWEKFTDNAVWRRKDNRKWYGALLTVKKNRFGFDDDSDIAVIDLRINPETDGNIVDGKKYFAGYHMNKRTWMTILLDGTVSVQEIEKWIDKSYMLAKGR